MRHRIAFVLVFLSVAAAVVCFAQTENATISGRITDPTGAVVAGVTVRLTSAERGTVTETATNGHGIYLFPAVLPGVYHIELQKPGFRQVDYVGLTANVQAHIEQNFTLSIGAVSESVTIRADAEHMNTVDASVGTVIDRQFVSNIPLNGRSLQTLIALSPGITATPVSGSGSDQGQFSVNGMRSNANILSVDGVSANFGVPVFEDLSQGGSGSLPATNIQGGFSNLVSIDALQEFKIQTSTFAPEYGRSPGAQISLVTRSGTNQFHGSVYNYFRNDALDSVSYFDNKKTPLRYNDFGGTLGGPVRLPGYNGRDKTFFFFSYEGQRFLLPQPRLITFVPSLAARKGAPNAIAQSILNAFPLPTGPDVLDDTGTPTGAALLTASYSDLNSADAYSIRVDHHFNQKYSVFGRYNRAPSYSDSRQGNLSELSRFIQDTETLTLGSSQMFTGKLINEARFNLSRNFGRWHQTFDGFGGGQAPPSPSLFLPAPGRYAYFILVLNDAASNSTSPNVQSAGVQFGPTADNEGRSINAIDNVNWLAGKHLLKFGVDYRWLSPIQKSAPLIVTSIFLDMNSVYNNRPDLIVFLDNAETKLRATNFSAYAQDTWHATPLLALTYGVRWDIVPPPSLAGGKKTITLAQPPDLSSLDQSSLQLAKVGTPYYPTNFTRFAPRLGLAYQIVPQEGRTLVLRAGGGVFYDLGSTPLNGGTPWPYSHFKFKFGGVPLPLTAADVALPAPDFTPSPDNPAHVPVAAKGFTLPRTYQWNLTLEQQIKGTNLVSVGYVGSAGRKLLRTLDLQIAPPGTAPNVYFSDNFNAVTYVDNSSSSDYHSLQVQYTRRLSHGLQGLLNYTWSHSTDDSSSDSNVLAPGFFIPTSANRGRSDFDVRHSMTGAITYDIPAPKGNAFAHTVLKDWSISSTFFAHTGLPFDVRYIETDPVFFFFTDARRLDRVPGVPLWLHDSTVPGHRLLNVNAFSPPADGSIGTLGRNSLTGFSAWQADVGIHRTFGLTERLKMEFRGELFNIFNHPNFANPDTEYVNNGDGTVTISPTFGQAVTTLARGFNGGGNTGGFNPLFQNGGPRSVQFALRLQF